MIFQFGENKFLNKCKKAGVDSLLLLIPWPENKVLQVNKKINYFCTTIISYNLKNKIKKNCKRLMI